MPDKESVKEWLEEIAYGYAKLWSAYYSEENSKKLAEAALILLQESEIRELTIEEWQKWKTNRKRDPICQLWAHDDAPKWIMNPNEVHEPALLMGQLKLFTKRPTYKQCKEIKWDA